MRLIVLAAAGLFALAGCSKDDKTPTATAPATPAATPAPAPATPAPAPAASPQQRVFAREELDQMVAPIALYPDSLLAQVLMAATYPGEIADAVGLVEGASGRAGRCGGTPGRRPAQDASVQSLVAFPQALATLGQDPVWVQKLGDAFAAQPNDVMDAVQRLRRQAQAAGNLDSNQYQKVSVQPLDAPPPPPAPVAAGGEVIVETPPSQVIVIEPAQPDVVYVPSYNPTTVYGSWAYPAYPPVYYPPPVGYYPGGALLSFGIGVAVGGALWGTSAGTTGATVMSTSTSTSTATTASTPTARSTAAATPGTTIRRTATACPTAIRPTATATATGPTARRTARSSAATTRPAPGPRTGPRLDGAARRGRAGADQCRSARARPAGGTRPGTRTRRAGHARAHPRAGDRAGQRADGPQGERDAARQRAQATAQRDLDTGQNRGGRDGGQQRARTDTQQRDSARASTQQRQQASQHRWGGATSRPATRRASSIRGSRAAATTPSRAPASLPLRARRASAGRPASPPRASTARPAGPPAGRSRAPPTPPIVADAADSRRRTMNRFRTPTLLLGLATALPGTALAQQAFPSPEDAASALVDALGTDRADPAKLEALLGKRWKDYVPADVERSDVQAFLDRYRERHAIEAAADNRALLSVGTDPWTFPVPLAKGAKGWAFDLEAGAAEIRTRAIGRNELAAISSALAYRDAQLEYAAEDRDGDGMLEYAQKFVSTDGSHDGLYWSEDDSGELSPLGPLFGDATPKGDWHGYRFRILTAQGPSAPGGAYSYRIGDDMSRGFALVALAHPVRRDRRGQLHRQP